MAARVHVLDTDDDAGPCEDIELLAKTHSGPCEDIVVLAKTHSGASEDTYCGSGIFLMGHPWSLWVANGKYGSPMVNMGHQGSDMVRNSRKRPIYIF